VLQPADELVPLGQAHPALARSDYASPSTNTQNSQPLRIGRSRLLLSDKLSSEVPCVCSATIPFLGSDRRYGPGAGNPYGDASIARIWPLAADRTGIDFGPKRGSEAENPVLRPNNAGLAHAPQRSYSACWIDSKDKKETPEWTADAGKPLPGAGPPEHRAATLRGSN
jgi:hypothetical protein